MSLARIWEESVTIPTYAVGRPDRNPMFLEKRVYQGSSGVVYPHPVIDRVFDEKKDVPWRAVFLENRWLKIMILPELGGRVQMALDKTNDYHFIYYNRVIKPALVGLAGPWISGGIELNWPQHHRPSTFEPVEYALEENADGSVTAWCSEIERMFRLRAVTGFTLRPDHACLEVAVRLSNRTSEPQTFLWWANPAVHAGDDYQSIFPPDVQAVMDHGKRAVSSFPIATGVYYKVDYSPGTDISRYRNIPVPTSFMAHRSDFDFIGCYDHARHAGMMHVADHHVVPGKKQWTWGYGDFGRAWDRELTDEDGPYVELMCGAFTDNQPDFSWLMPGEQKAFTQIFFPYKGTGGAKNASRAGVVNLEVANGEARLGVYLTSSRTVRAELIGGGRPLFEKELTLEPARAFTHALRLPPGLQPQELTLRVLDEERVLLECQSEVTDETPLPQPATAARRPEEIASSDELFLTGLHLEQYRHATYAPEPYYLEALRRDPLDSRCANAMGLLLYRRGCFAEAEAYFRTAIRSLTRRNPNPHDGEPFYNLGLALRMQGRYSEAWPAFHKAAWNEACQAAAWFELARLAARRGDLPGALDLVSRSLTRNTRHDRAGHLQIAILRRLGRLEEARARADEILAADPLEVGALNERRLLGGPDDYRAHLRGNTWPSVELSLDYAHAGLFDEAIALLEEAAAPPTADRPRSPERDACPASPMIHYHLGWVRLQKGDETGARSAFRHGSELPPDYCFPNELECVPALTAASALNPRDARAPYYLGLFWYAHRRPREAIVAWERSARLDPAFPTVHRNLALAYFNKEQKPAKARRALDRALALDPTDARVLFERDQLDRRLGAAPRPRLRRLERSAALVDQRDDLSIERVTLLNRLGRHEEALALVTARRFHPWEGGEGKSTGQYVKALLGLAHAHLEAGRFPEALSALERARDFPASLGEGKLAGDRESDVLHFIGVALMGLGRTAEARETLRQAARGPLEPTSATYYNDQSPDLILYRGLAERRLGRDGRAKAIFRRLVDYGRRHLGDTIEIDYFAVSLPDFLVFDDDLDLRNRSHCHYMMGLGHLGLRSTAAARRHLTRVLALDPSHVGAAMHLRWLESLTAKAETR